MLASLALHILRLQVNVVVEAVGKDAAKADFTPNLAGFTFPTLVIAGRYDMNVAPLSAWRLQQAIPVARILLF